ncbi:MAG TPA: NAD(P)H-binding protein [Longimicrobiaceae bacterium]|nr:NAD(P)H-binding protein [Longimicrobiaceae bacterium]
MLVVFVLTSGCATDAAEVEQERIIVSGASGQLGGLVVEELLGHGVSADRLILVSRTPEELERYAAMGATVRFGDFTQPESLVDAYAGGSRMLLISISTLGERPRLHGNAIEAAVAAGVRHIAYTSFVDADDNPSPLAADHRETEALLRQSGVAWTMLRNQLYMDGLVGRAAGMVADGRVEVRSGEQGTAYVARADCAAAAAAVLTQPGHENQVYDITGPEVIGTAELARIAAEVAGTPIEVVETAAGVAGGPPAPAANPSFEVVSTAVTDLTGRAPISAQAMLEANREALLAPR